MKILDLTITDGPWEAVKRKAEEGYTIVGDTGIDKDGIESSVDVAYVFSKYTNPKLSAGNAKLVAAAPDMALLLIDVLENVKLDDDLRHQIEFTLNSFKAKEQCDDYRV